MNPGNVYLTVQAYEHFSKDCPLSESTYVAISRLKELRVAAQSARTMDIEEKLLASINYHLEQFDLWGRSVSSLDSQLSTIR